MKRTALLAGLLAGSVLTGLVSAAEVTVHQDGVSGDFANIPDAITATMSGDTIRVIDGMGHGAFAVPDARIFVSDPAGAAISGGTVVINAPAGETVTFNGFSFDDSVAQSGNALFVNQPGTLDLLNCTIENIANHGVLFNDQEDATLLATNTTWNNCGENAITMFRSATVTLTDCSITNSGGTGGGRSGIFIDGNQSTATGRVITLDNTSITGSFDSGIKSFRGMDLTLTNGSSITGHTLYGMFLDGDVTGSTVFVMNGSVSNNGFDGVFCGRPIDLILDGVTVDNNGRHGVFVEDFVGAGIPTVFQILFSTISNNGVKGAQLKTSNGNGDALVVDSTFEGNGERALTLEGTSGSSGVLMDVQRNIIRDGSGGAHWAAILFNPLAGSTAANNVVDGGDAGIATAFGSIDIIHNTIVNVAGGGVEIDDGAGNAINILNNIIAQGDAGFTSGSGLGLGSVLADFNLVDVTDDNPGAFPLGGNNDFTSAPGFVAGSTTVGAGDYQLATGSAAIAAGTSTAVMEDILFNSRPDPMGTMPDIGAYESPEGGSSVGDWSTFE